jgi:site-specific DNA-methyltransferase (adenine-specific)
MSDGKYAFEKSKIIQGDCLEKMKLIPDGSVDAIIADPPYGSTKCKWDDIVDLDLMWKQLNRIVKPSGAIVLFGAEPYSSKLRISNIEDYKYDWVWDKNTGTNFQQVKRQPMRYTENIIVFTKHNYYPIKTLRGKEKDYSNCRTLRSTNKNINHFNSDESKLNVLRKDKYPSNIIRISSQQAECNNINRIHPTQKPVELLEYLVKTYTKEGEIVLDFTAGSGTTGEACINLNRNFILIEKEPNYYEVIKERVGKIFKNYGLDLQPLLNEQM